VDYEVSLGLEGYWPDSSPSFDTKEMMLQRLIYSVRSLCSYCTNLRAENERLRDWIRDAAKNGCDSYITINCAGAGHNECDWCLPCRAVAFLAPKEDKG
jgi:hypothetical protein